MTEGCEWCGAMTDQGEPVEVDGPAAFPVILCPECCAAWMRGENRPVRYPREIGAEEWNSQFVDPDEYREGKSR